MARSAARAVEGDLAQYLLAADDSLTPTALLRAGGLAVGSLGQTVTYDYALARRVRTSTRSSRCACSAHQAEGHLSDNLTLTELRSPFDAHARHLTCRFGGRIVGYVRVIFVDRDPARSQYVSLGGHEVPLWLWDAGFVEAGAGAMHPEFQRAGLFVPLIAHSARVAVQAGYRYILGASDNHLLGMYGEMGFEVLEERICEPKPGWRFRSHPIHLDAERLVGRPPATRILADMAAAIRFALGEREHVADLAAQRAHRRRIVPRDAQDEQDRAVAVERDSARSRPRPGQRGALPRLERVGLLVQVLEQERRAPGVDREPAPRRLQPQTHQAAAGLDERGRIDGGGAQHERAA